MFVPPHLGMRRRDLVPGEDLGHARVDAAIEQEFVSGCGLLEMSEMRALNALLPHPDEARVESEIVPRRAGAEDHHAAALDHEARDRKRLLARMLEDDIDVL